MPRFTNKLPDEDIKRLNDAYNDIHAVAGQAFAPGEGQAIIGQETLRPVAEVLEYTGLARKVLRMRLLVQGELFRLARSSHSVSWAIGTDGSAVENRAHGFYLQPSEFRVGSCLDLETPFKADEINQIQNEGLDNFLRTEDSLMIKLLDAAATAVNTVTIASAPSRQAFEQTRFQVERHRYVGTKFLVSRDDVDAWKTAFGNLFDPCNQPDLVAAGYPGKHLGAQIICEAEDAPLVLPRGTAYVVADPEYLGEFGVRIEPFSECFKMQATAERPATRGYAWVEIIGMGLVESKGVAKLVIA